MKRASGYIAIDRGIFDHPMFRGRPHRLIAWQWMIAKAAWKPTGQAMSNGVADLARGQIATTLRDLAEALGWRKSTTEYFLNRLQAEGMIQVSTVRTKSRTRIGTKNSHPATIITICNYDKFQNGPQRRPSLSGQELGQELGQEPKQQPLFTEESAPLTTEPLNQRIEAKGSMDSGGEDKRASPTAPRHGARSTKHSTVYVYRGTEDWRVYSDDYKATIGAEPIPDRHGGFWFFALGEAARPPHQRTWRRRDAFGAAKYGGRR